MVTQNKFRNALLHLYVILTVISTVFWVTLIEPIDMYMYVGMSSHVYSFITAVMSTIGIIPIILLVYSLISIILLITFYIVFLKTKNSKPLIILSVVDLVVTLMCISWTVISENLLVNSQREFLEMSIGFVFHIIYVVLMIRVRK